MIHHQGRLTSSQRAPEDLVRMRIGIRHSSPAASVLKRWIQKTTLGNRAVAHGHGVGIRVLRMTATVEWTPKSQFTRLPPSGAASVAVDENRAMRVGGAVFADGSEEHSGKFTVSSGTDDEQRRILGCVDENSARDSLRRLGL